MTSKLYSENIISLNTEEADLNKDLTYWIQTYTGKKFYPANPLPELIDIEDIAHSLSMQCRFTGHCKIHYSIAQHSVYVSYFCKNKMQGLLHDASEAYISDISSPVKRLSYLEGYKTLEKSIQTAIYKKFNTNILEDEDLKKADMLMLGIEVKSLVDNIHPDWKFNFEIPPFDIKELSPKEAKSMFLRRFEELKGKNFE